MTSLTFCNRNCTLDYLVVFISFADTLLCVASGTRPRFTLHKCSSLTFELDVKRSVLNVFDSESFKIKASMQTRRPKSVNSMLVP
jgi:hypothetical protein